MCAHHTSSPSVLGIAMHNHFPESSPCRLMSCLNGHAYGLEDTT